MRFAPPVLFCAILAALPVWAEDAADRSRIDPVALERARSMTAGGARALRKGNSDAAATRFTHALALVPDSREARRNLALALSRQADQHLKVEQGAEALALYDRALELHPGRLVYRARRGRALLQSARAAEALRDATELTQTAPDMGEAWLLRADAAEREGELADAVLAMERSIILLAEGGRLEWRLDALRRRLETEGRFLTHATGHFIVKYGAEVPPETVELALTMLEDAWSRVTADLGITPKTAAQVVLYTGDEFRDVTQAHGWVGALYANGTLRVPVKNLQQHRDTASRILSHEFTHHVLREATPRLPVWWHEGIAQWAESPSAATDRVYRRVAARLPAYRDSKSLFTLEQLQKTHIASVRDSAAVQLYYAQAKSFVLWLVDQRGAGALTAFLIAMGSTSDTDAAGQEAFGRSIAELYGDWRSSL